MSFSVVYSRASLGIQAPLIQVEVHLSAGLPGFAMVGLPEAVVKESKERVRSAIINSQFEFPCSRITVNLAPADLPKEDGRYDLAIAIGILAASAQVPQQRLHQYEFGGELGLAGELRTFAGMLPMMLAAKGADRTVILPKVAASEVLHLAEVTVLQAPHLLAVCQHLHGQSILTPPELPSAETVAAVSPLDLADVCGQYQAKRALEVAAAGGHSLLLCGPPGSGKSMLANRLPGILPPLTAEQVVEVAAIYAMRAPSAESLSSTNPGRPFRAPHHSVSSVALVGGGRRARPGEVSLAHHGVLFLDELPEFSRVSLEGLREPLEERAVTISRAAYSIHYPAHFQLIAAMNPCPCGYWQDGSTRCQCTPDQVRRYQARLSGPFLDRMDLMVATTAVPLQQLVTHQPKQNIASSIVRERVAHARALQQNRAGVLNASLGQAALAEHCALDAQDQLEFQTALDHMGFSARGYHRLLKVARTIADLAKADRIEKPHWQEAIMLKKLKLVGAS